MTDHLYEEIRVLRTELRAAQDDLAQLGADVLAACSAAVDADVSPGALRIRKLNAAGMDAVGQMVILKADYERLLASIPHLRGA